MPSPAFPWGLLLIFSTSLAPVTTQHALTTQRISISEDNTRAKAMTYFTGVHLGKGRWKGQMVTAYGVYSDQLQCFPNADASKKMPGASGEWLISNRVVAFMGRIGEEGVMKGDEGVMEGEEGVIQGEEGVIKGKDTEPS